MFTSLEEEFRRGSPIGAWRRVYRTHESVIAPVLVEFGERWPGLLVGSYPTFAPTGPEVEVVVKSSDADELAAASAWLEAALARRRRLIFPVYNDGPFGPLPSAVEPRDD